MYKRKFLDVDKCEEQHILSILTRFDGIGILYVDVRNNLNFLVILDTENCMNYLTSRLELFIYKSEISGHSNIFNTLDYFKKNMDKELYTYIEKDLTIAKKALYGL